VQEKAALQEEKLRALQSKLDAAAKAAPAAAPAQAQAVQPAQAAQQAQPEIQSQIESLKAELEKSRAEMQGIKSRAAKPAAAKAQTKPQQPAARKSYMVKDGDTLESIAASVYGDPERWPEIYRANSGSVGRGGEVKAGQVIVIP
jgi:nucleoid-associated protein YgaU